MTELKIAQVLSGTYKSGSGCSAKQWCQADDWGSVSPLQGPRIPVIHVTRA